MLYRLIALSVLTLSLGACATFEGPRDAAEMRQIVATNGMFGADTYTVARSVPAITASLRTAADRCLSFDESMRMTGPTLDARTNRSYRAFVRRAGGRTTLEMRYFSPNDPANDDWATLLVADVTPSNAGASMTIYAPTFAQFWARTVRQHANGDFSTCPAEGR